MSGSLELRPHQVQALADLTRAFAVHDRAVLVLPCDVFPSEPSML